MRRQQLVRCIKGDVKCAAATDIQKNKKESTDGAGQVAVTQSPFPVVSFSAFPESTTALLMIWLAKPHVVFTQCVGFVGFSVVPKCNATETRRAKRQERLPVLGSSVSSNWALRGTSARSRGHPDVCVWLSTTSSVKALTKRKCERVLSQSLNTFQVRCCCGPFGVLFAMYRL